MQRVTSAVVAICLAGMVVPTVLADDWTWCGGPGNWTLNNWDKEGAGCSQGGYPNVATDNVSISGGSSDVTLDVHLITIGSLEITNGATVTVEKLVFDVGVLKIVGENGLRLENDNTKLLIEGGVVELTGGGDVYIADTDDTCVILFQTVADGRLIFGGNKVYTIIRAKIFSGTDIKDSIRSQGVHGFIDGGTGTDEVVMLFEGRIKGNITITAQLINAGEVINDPNVLTEPLTLCGRPKMGSGLWRAGHNENPREIGKIVADAIVVGDSCSVLHVEHGTIDVNTFWLSAGQLRMEPDQSPATRLEVASSKIMQFGLRNYCACVDN